MPLYADLLSRFAFGREVGREKGDAAAVAVLVARLGKANTPGIADLNVLKVAEEPAIVGGVGVTGQLDGVVLLWSRDGVLGDSRRSDDGNDFEVNFPGNSCGKRRCRKHGRGKGRWRGYVSDFRDRVGHC